MLYNETDFSEVESLLETTCKARGFQILFLPKFHCELNFIEQCWGYSKRIYGQYPISSKEDDLEHNVLKVLLCAAGIYVQVCNLIAVLHGWLLVGFEWETGHMASKKYGGHRVLPETIMEEIELELVDQNTCHVLQGPCKHTYKNIFFLSQNFGLFPWSHDLDEYG